jgi:hypothetical protein
MAGSGLDEGQPASTNIAMNGRSHRPRHRLAINHALLEIQTAGKGTKACSFTKNDLGWAGTGFAAGIHQVMASWTMTATLLQDLFVIGSISRFSPVPSPMDAVAVGREN